MTERYGIGEWYGLSLVKLRRSDRHRVAKVALSHTQKRRTTQPCPFKPSVADELQPCTKRGGVCSIRLYRKTSSRTTIVRGARGALRITCPHRFEQGGIVFNQAGRRVLGSGALTRISQVGFLSRHKGGDVSAGTDGDRDSSEQDVGKIDTVLVEPESAPLQWCAVELQAVYFSGKRRREEFIALRDYKRAGIPFPAETRGPDYRSSGPKRLMPQLQVKVPSLRRWGKKMVVVVDLPFFSALGRMQHVDHLSNADIVWLVVSLSESADRPTAVLRVKKMVYVTLEDAVTGLVAGRPKPLDQFEAGIRAKSAYRAAVTTRDRARRRQR